MTKKQKREEEKAVAAGWTLHKRGERPTGPTVDKHYVARIFFKYCEDWARQAIRLGVYEGAEQGGLSPQFLDKDEVTEAVDRVLERMRNRL